MRIYVKFQKDEENYFSQVITVPLGKRERMHVVPRIGLRERLQEGQKTGKWELTESAKTVDKRGITKQSGVTDIRFRKSIIDIVYLSGILTSERQEVMNLNS